MLAQAQLGNGVCFYPSRQQRVRQLWRKRCIKGGVGLGVGLLLSLGLGPGYSLASAYWSGAPQPPREIAQAAPLVANTPAIEPWMEKELNRVKEPLELFSLEDLRVVGLIHQDRSAKALILVKGQQSLGIHSVRLGDHLGKKLWARVADYEQRSAAPRTASRWFGRMDRAENQLASGNRCHIKAC